MSDDNFNQELAGLEKEVENALIKLFDFTNADSTGWNIDLPSPTKKIVFSANVETQCPCCSVKFK